MTAKQLKTMPLTGLQALHAKIGAMIKARKAQASDVKKKVAKFAKQLGMTTRELGEFASRRGPDRAPRKPRKVKEAAAEAKPAKAGRWARRRDKDNGVAGEHATRH